MAESSPSAKHCSTVLSAPPIDSTFGEDSTVGAIGTSSGKPHPSPPDRDTPHGQMPPTRVAIGVCITKVGHRRKVHDGVTEAWRTPDHRESVGAILLGIFDRMNRIDRLTTASRIASEYPVDPVDPVKTSSPLGEVRHVTRLKVRLRASVVKLCLLF